MKDQGHYIKSSQSYLRRISWYQRAAGLSLGVMSTASKRDEDEVWKDDGPLQYGLDMDPGVCAMFKATYQHFDNRMKALDETVTDGF